MDLNLIRVFVSIYEGRNLTTAASRLFVTQSAVSQSLARMRKALDDNLFERRGREMVPTAVAHDLYPAFRQAAQLIDGALGKVEVFDPHTSTRKFRIALSELGEVGWLANMVSDIRREAPHVVINTVPLEVTEVHSWLTGGVVDLAVAPVDLSAGLERTAIKTQTYAAVMSTEHPLAEHDLSLEAYIHTPRALVSSDSAVVQLEAAEHKAGVHTVPAVTYQHYASLPSLVLDSPDLMAVAPSTIAHGWARAWPLVVKDLPFDMDPITLFVYRRPGTHNNSGLDWLYRTVLKAAVGLPTRFDNILADEHPS